MNVNGTPRRVGTAADGHDNPEGELSADQARHRVVLLPRVLVSRLVMPDTGLAWVRGEVKVGFLLFNSILSYPRTRTTKSGCHDTTSTCMDTVL